jgi:hypothetical protein
MPVLRGAVADLASDFNAAPHVTRIVLLVSPTCPDCLHGASLVADGLRRHPDNDVRVFVLWVLALSGDSADAAAVVAGDRFGVDSRAHHYWEEDGGWSLASAFRPAIGLGPIDPEQIAWDVYLLYRPGIRWDSTPPTPTDWAHNLRYPPSVQDSPVGAENAIRIRRPGLS